MTAKKAKVDYDQEAEAIRARMTATASPALNQQLQEFVRRFEGDADTEQVFLRLLVSGDTPAHEQADETRLKEVLEGLEGQKHVSMKVCAYSKLLPAYNEALTQLQNAEQAKKEIERAMQYS